MGKEYIFLFNSDNDTELEFIKNFLQDDVIIKDYGIQGGCKVSWIKSIWVTKDKYKYAYAIMQSPVYEFEDEEYVPLTLEDCEEWMKQFIDVGAIHRQP